MNIAICDDDIIFLNKLQKYTNEIMKEMKINIEILALNDGESLFNSIQNKKKYFDILLLDIDMPDVSGLKVAKTLRQIDVDIIIIFISSYEKYVFDSLEYKSSTIAVTRCYK